MTGPLRVGLVCPYSLSWPGGVQTHVEGLAAALQWRGHSVRVLAPCDGAPVLAMHDAAGRSTPIAANGSVARLALGPGAVRRAKRWSQGRFDVIHVHEPFTPVVSLAVTAFSPAPLVGTFHASAERWWPYDTFGPALRALSERLSAKAAVSDAAESLAAQHFPGPYARTPNGLDVEGLSAVEPDPEAPAVLFVGRFEPRKGAAVMVEAARQIDATVGLVGDGAQRAELQAVAPPHVRFFGAVAGPRLAALRRGARVICAPSLGGESFGLVVLEAMSAGAAVVASDIPGYRSVLGEAGRLVEPGDAAALAAAVNQLLADPGDLPARALGAARQFSWRHLAAGVEDLYRSVI